jgi:hypothetical protein
MVKEEVHIVTGVPERVKSFILRKLQLQFVVDNPL